jgi:KDO2-lipid IV(A) lauroyltransferase
MLKREEKSLRGGRWYFLRYRAGEYCLRGFIAVLPYFPRRLLGRATDFAGKLTFMLLGRYRRRMEQTLFSVIGAEVTDAAQRKALLERAWRNFARGIYETGCVLNASREEIRRMVVLEGEENLRKALAKGNGVIALSAHLGNFTMIGPRLAAGGYSFNALVKQPADEGFARLMDELREKVGVKTISAKPRREAVRSVLAALRKNEIVLIIADEFKSGKVEVEFLGRRAPAPRGPITLALRTGAAVVPTFVTRDRLDQLTLRIAPEIELVKTESLGEGVAANTLAFSRHLEEMVRRYPEQWSWLGFRENGRRRAPKSRGRAANQHKAPEPLG